MRKSLQDAITIVNVPDGTYGYLLNADVTVKDGKVVDLSTDVKFYLCGQEYADGSRDVGLLRDYEPEEGFDNPRIHWPEGWAEVIDAIEEDKGK